MKDTAAVLPEKFGGGPLGLGDPNDKSLRKVEREVMIPKKMRDIARTEKCFQEVEQFSKCCKDSGVTMVLSCRTENSQLKDCLSHWYKDDEFIQRCTNEYLDERSEFRRTGIRAKQREGISKRLG